MSDAMAAEFDTVAEWTAQVAVALGHDYYLPAGCRGSGSPAALDWLIDSMGIGAGDTLVDSGAGVGGPAAYSVLQRGVDALLFEPEGGACRAAARLFALPVVQASGTGLPIADQAVDAAWSLGVLCTTQDQLGLLNELRRVVKPPGRIGLLVYVATAAIPEAKQPQGNKFPSAVSLAALIDEAGLKIVGQQASAELAAAPKDWQQRADTLEEELCRLHGHQRAWRLAEQQSALMGELVADTAVIATLLHLRHR